MLEFFLPPPKGAPHPRPDHPLQDSTRLRFLTPRPEPPEGISTMRADLSAFFVVVDAVGRDEALLLLLAKALRQRTGLLALRVNDLAWMLRVSNRRVIRWLDRLTRSGHLIYHVEDLWGIDTVLVEIVAGVQARHAERTVQQDLPTHWFVQVLPLVGRTTFTVYLYLLWCEPHRPASHVDHMIGMVRLRGRVHARWHLRKLERRALLRRHPEHGGLVVADPTPPSRSERLLLRYLAIPFLRRALVHLAVLATAILLLVLFLALLARTPT
ncbi:MAG TPA: hypothetical protein VEO54_15345 [Thermoanaerobaculia bacterium]|nr:hypothetical protein [Thermoanaerobaculia bacterium]